MPSQTFGLIVGNRGFFPDALARDGRRQMAALLKKHGLAVVAPGDKDTKYGCIETYAEAKACAALLKANREKISGLVVTLPNFGDEKGVADTIRMAGLNVPVLIHAYPDDPASMGLGQRRDSFCGKLSVCNNLAQYGIPFTLTTTHTVDPATEEFSADLRRFAATCRVVGGLRGARIGAVGARPAAFNTCRFSEKILEENGISVETIDLYDLFGAVNALKDNDPAVKRQAAKLKGYIDTSNVPAEPLARMARFAVALNRWIKANELVGTAVQCWTAIEKFFGIVPCSVMSMLSEAGCPSACEVDICGLVGMLALQFAGGSPSALLDWNNNYGDDPNKAVGFHCSNLPRSVFAKVRMDFQDIIAGDVGQQNAYGACQGRIKAGPFTYCRVSTDDAIGGVAAYCGEGQFTDDPLETFGGYGVIEVPNFQKLLRFACQRGFEHHVAVNFSQTAAAIEDAMSTYLNWDVYLHE